MVTFSELSIYLVYREKDIKDLADFNCLIEAIPFHFLRFFRLEVSSPTSCSKQGQLRDQSICAMLKNVFLSQMFSFILTQTCLFFSCLPMHSCIQEWKDRASSLFSLYHPHRSCITAFCLWMTGYQWAQLQQAWLYQPPCIETWKMTDANPSFTIQNVKEDDAGN